MTSLRTALYCTSRAGGPMVGLGLPKPAVRVRFPVGAVSSPLSADIYLVTITKNISDSDFDSRQLLTPLLSFNLAYVRLPEC